MHVLIFVTVAIMCETTEDGTTIEDRTTIEDGTTAGPPKSRMSDQQVAYILGAIKNSQVEMQSLRREMRESHEEAAAKMEAMRREKPLTFYKKAHEVQHSFNQSVEERLKGAESSLAKAGRLLEPGGWSGKGGGGAGTAGPHER